MNVYQAAVETRIAQEESLKHAPRFAKHLAQAPCDTDGVKKRIRYYLEGLGGDEDAWNPPHALHGDRVTLWLLCNALDFSRNVQNVDFVLEGLAAERSSDSEYTAASALFNRGEEMAIFPPLTNEEKVRRLTNLSFACGH